LNERSIENEATESPREGGSEENNDATRPPRRAEILREIKRLVNGKAVGESGIVVEFLKAGRQLSRDWRSRRTLIFVSLTWREGLFRKMEQEGVSVKLVRVWYQGVSIKLTVNDVPSSSF
jgi:hypothetical protein